MKLASVISMLSLFASLPLAAQEHVRQLGAHEHGRGFLNIAVEGNRVSIEFQAPGSDIARSEAKPNTPERKAAVAAAIATLEKPLELFTFPAAAGCTVVSVQARMSMVGEDEHAHAGGGHDHEKGAKQETHGHTDSAGEGHAGHSDYHGSYELTCSAQGRLTSIELPYFKVFPRAEKLSVQIAGPKGQTQTEAIAAKPSVSLAGAM